MAFLLAGYQPFRQQGVEVMAHGYRTYSYRLRQIVNGAARIVEQGLQDAFPRAFDVHFGTNITPLPTFLIALWMCCSLLVTASIAKVGKIVNILEYYHKY